MSPASIEKAEVVVASPTVTRSSITTDPKYDAESGRVNGHGVSWLRFWRRPDHVRVPKQPDPKASNTRSLDESPEGYAEVATFQSSDPNFLQYRGFGYLHARLLSDSQYEVECMETELESLDRWDRASGDKDKLHCKDRDGFEDAPDRVPGDFQIHFTRTRPQLMKEMRRAVLEYDEILLKTKEMTALQKPSRRDYESVRDWFHDFQPLVDSEQSFIRRKEDIITLRNGRECAGFDSFIERVLSRIDRFLANRCRCRIIQWLFKTPELQAKTSNRRLHYYAPARVNRLVNVIITVMIFVLLVLPVVAMYELSNMNQRASPFEAIGILIVFTLLFGAAMSGLTKATRQELFGASAAYCAVLVVFITNFSVQSVVMVQQ